MRTSIIGSAFLALCLVAVGASAQAAGPLEVATPSGISPSSLLDDVALSGTIEGGQLTADSLLVGIKEGNWRDLPEGSSFEIYQVPTDQVHVTGDTWSVTLNPATYRVTSSPPMDRWTS